MLINLYKNNKRKLFMSNTLFMIAFSYYVHCIILYNSKIYLYLIITRHSLFSACVMLPNLTVNILNKYALSRAPYKLGFRIVRSESDRIYKLLKWVSVIQHVFIHCATFSGIKYFHVFININSSFQSLVIFFSYISYAY